MAKRNYRKTVCAILEFVSVEVAVWSLVRAISSGESTIAETRAALHDLLLEYPDLVPQADLIFSRYRDLDGSIARTNG
jgi:hypothetical protein